MTFDITMRAKDPKNPIVSITVRISGMQSVAAVQQAEKDFTDYKFHYVLRKDE